MTALRKTLSYGKRKNQCDRFAVKWCHKVIHEQESLWTIEKKNYTSLVLVPKGSYCILFKLTETQEPGRKKTINTLQICLVR